MNNPQIAARLGGIKNSLSEVAGENPPVVIDTAPGADTGAEVSASPPPVSRGDIRIFRSHPAGSRFQFSQQCEYKEINFTRGWYETSNPQEIKELDAVANKPGSIIYTDEAQDKLLKLVNEARRRMDEEGIATDTAQILNQAVMVGEMSHKESIAVGVLSPNTFVGAAVQDPEASLLAAIKKAGSEASVQS